VEARLGAPLARDLLEQTQRLRVSRLALEDGLETGDRARRILAVVVEVGEEEEDLGVELGANGALERAERVVGTPCVDGREPEPLEERRRLGCFGEALAEEQERLVGPALA